MIKELKDIFSSVGKLYTDTQGMSVANKMALADLSKFVGLTTSMVMLAAAALNDDKDENTGVVFGSGRSACHNGSDVGFQTNGVAIQHFF